MMADPLAALQNARAAEQIAQGHPSSARYRTALATSLWLEAEALTRLSRLPEARLAVTRATDLAEADRSLDKLDGDLALARGRIAETGGNVALALKSYQQAHAIFAHLGLRRSQSLALVGLGLIFDQAHDYSTAIRYYREAAQVYSADPALAISGANNLGFALLQMGRYEDALRDFRRALKTAADLKSDLLQAQILTNIAGAETHLHRLGEADRAANAALRLLGKRDEVGQTTIIWGVKAEVDYQRGALASAAADLAKAFRGVNLTTTIAPFRDMHEIAYKVYRAQGNLPLALTHLEAFKRLDDQGRSLAASANLSLMSAKFDFARQQLEIEHLKSEQLQRDISLRKSRAATQSLVFAAIVLSAILFLAWIAWRHSMLESHRKAITAKNVELTKTLAQRDGEIERRTVIESQLRLAMETAQQASRAKSHFLANMSHELRTPLNAIIGFSELMVSGKFKAEKLQEYASSILEGGQHLLSILNDILDMARIEAGRVALDEGPVCLGDIVDYSLSVLGCDRHMDGKRVTVAGRDHGIVVHADELRLRQVLINLVSNALKFTGEDGRIEVRIEPMSDGVDLVVADNGKGIPAEKLDIIMEPFGQAESTYTRSHGGVGLGLPIVKSLAELHGGRLTITSEISKGTVARVHLPADRVMNNNHIGSWPAAALTTTSAA
ncbi:MAG: tetratricopeptide repeat protein [Alphaproteobacteria bacterium]|nr:tetratricopeptide repeat protein [Alphaproteobacteria bacterium]